MSALSDATLAAVEVLDEVLRKHDEEEHDGEACWDERVNVVAFIAHQLGLRFETNKELAVFAQAFNARLRDYQAIHAEHAHDD